MTMYSLTELTGKRSQEGRRMVVARFSVDRSIAIACLIGVLPGFALAGVVVTVLQPLLGSDAWASALLAAPIPPAIACLLLVGRQRSGMRLHHYQWLRNEIGARSGARRNANFRGEFLVGGDRMHTPDFVVSHQASIWQHVEGEA